MMKPLATEVGKSVQIVGRWNTPLVNWSQFKVRGFLLRASRLPRMIHRDSSNP